MAADIGAVGDRGLHSVGSATGFTVRGIGKRRGCLKLLAAVALGLVVIVAAVACFAVPPGMPKTARSFSNPWTIYTIDSNGGRWPSVAIDSNDYLHVSYVGNGSLMYATNVGGSWVISGIDNISGAPSLALDSEDNVHISAGAGYGTDAGGSWVTSTVDNASLGESSLALDSEDKAHISYKGHYGFYDWKDLRYATNVNGSWETALLSAHKTTATDIYSNSLAVDSSDKAHISYCYYNLTSQDPWALTYLTNANGSWGGGPIMHLFVDPLYTSTSIAIDSNDKVHICFNNYALFYATNANGSWEFSTIDSPGIVTHHDGFNAISLELDTNDKAHVSYFDTYYRTLKYATNANGSWEVSTIDDFCWMFGSSLALDSTGNVYIIYANLTNSIKYATNAEPVIPEFLTAGVVVVIIATVCVFIALRRTSFPSTKE